MEIIKKNFILGIVSGIAVISLAGFIIMTIAYYQKTNTEIAEKENNNLAKVEEEDEEAPEPIAKKVDIKITEADQIKGDKNAPVTIAVFSDFQCPYCARFHEVLNEAFKNYPKDVKLVFKNFPLPSHPYAKKAAVAAECAGQQGKFWEYADGLFANQDQISDNYLPRLAEDLDLNKDKFNSCLSDEKITEKVDADLAEGLAAGISATPTSVINGQVVRGAVAYSELKSIIEKLKK